MKKNNMVLMASILVSSLMAGCASSPSMQQLAEDEVQASAVRAKAAKQKQAQDQAQMEESISQIPRWALEQPRPDDTGVYAVGSSESTKARVAIKKAMLEGEFGLAKVYNQELSGSERSYTQDNGGTVGQEQYTSLIDKLVTQVPVVGFEVVKQEVKVIDGKYNAFVLIKLPYAQFNSVLKDQRAKTNDATVKSAFDDLERRLEKRRQQRIEEAKDAPKDVVGTAKNTDTRSVSKLTAQASAVTTTAEE